MTAMRRLMFVAVPLVLLLACSSDDATDSSTLERATVDGGVAVADGAAADGKVSSDGSSGGSEASADAAPPVDYSGEATYYAADGTGSCGFKASPNDLNVAALNKSQYAKSWCGQCALVTGPKGSVKVRIVGRAREQEHQRDCNEHQATHRCHRSSGESMRLSTHAEAHFHRNPLTTAMLGATRLAASDSLRPRRTKVAKSVIIDARFDPEIVMQVDDARAAAVNTSDSTR